QSKEPAPPPTIRLPSISKVLPGSVEGTVRSSSCSNRRVVRRWFLPRRLHFFSARRRARFSPKTFHFFSKKCMEFPCRSGMICVINKVASVPSAQTIRWDGVGPVRELLSRVTSSAVFLLVKRACSERIVNQFGHKKVVAMPPSWGFGFRIALENGAEL